jgi:hypothetical protein
VGGRILALALAVVVLASAPRAVAASGAEATAPAASGASCVELYRLSLAHARQALARGEREPATRHLLQALETLESCPQAAEDPAEPRDGVVGVG